MATPVRVYPLLRSPNGVELAGLPGVPHVAHEVETRKEADELIASGVFTDNANHADRVPSTEPSKPVAATEKEF